MASFPIALDAVNDMDEAAFVAAFGDIAEHSPWVAAEAAEARPLPIARGHDRSLHRCGLRCRRAAPARACSSPTRTSPDGPRSPANSRPNSRREQAGAGLDQLTGEEFARFTDLNRRYREGFGFPFILAVRGATKHDILNSLRRADRQRPGGEFATALRQVARIVALPARRPRVRHERYRPARRAGPGDDRRARGDHRPRKAG